MAEIRAGIFRSDLLYGENMVKWFENEEINNLAKECDEAFYLKDLGKLKKLAEICTEKAEKEEYSEMERAKLLYDAFTALNDWIQFSTMKDIEEKEYDSVIKGLKKYEHEYEKCLYLSRKALDLIDSASYIIFIDENEIEMNYFFDFYYSLIVNYTNLLGETGRIIKSIEILNHHNSCNYPMVIGNLGLKLINYSSFDYDFNHVFHIQKKAYEFLDRSLEYANPIREAEIKFQTEKKKIINFYGEESLKTPFKFEVSFMESDEIKYREWCSEKNLCLNTLNEIKNDIEIAYDPIHLPNMILPIDFFVVPKYHGLFNQIKQEFVSARYLAYEGLENREIHFSDKEVFLVNTLDYPIYGLGIEKVKAAYRSIYSIFDRIAYFLNEYLCLGIPEDKVSYKRICKNEKNDTNSFEKIIEENYLFLGLWWLFKDIGNKKIDEKNYLDPIMAIITEIRNTMEHRYLKILSDDMDISDDRKDILADNIRFEYFEYLTISLIKYAREAIILLVMGINAEERKRKNNKEKTIPTVNTFEYEDEWKQIFK